MTMLRLRKSLSKVGLLFVLCCSLVDSDSDADAGTTVDNQDAMITLATTVSNSASDNSPLIPPSPKEYTEYNEDDDMYLFGDYLNSVDEKQSVSSQDQQAVSSDDVKTESTGNVETSSYYPDSYIEDSEEADDLAMYAPQNAVEIKDIETSNRKEMSGGSDISEANEDVSSTIKNVHSNNVGGSDSVSSSEESGSSESSSGESDDSHSKSDSSDESESSSDSDVDSVSGDEDETDESNDVIDIEAENEFHLTGSSVDSSNSEEDSSGGDSKSKKNCKCKKEGGNEGGSGSKEGSDGTESDEDSSGTSNESSPRGGNVGDEGDSSTEEGYHSSSSEEFSSSESNEDYEKPGIPDSPKQTVDHGLDKEKNDYSTSIHHFFTKKTNTVVKVVNTHSSNTPFSPSGSDLSRNSDSPPLPQSSTSPNPTSPKSYFIIQLTTTSPPVGSDPPINNIENKGIPKWYEDLLRKREYVEQPVIRDNIPTPKTSFWQPPDVAKPPDWQDQKEWINIKINLEKPAHWIDDSNSNGSIPRWNIPYIPPDWFKRKNEKTTTQLNFELTTPDPKIVHWSPKPEERDRTTHIPEYLARKRVCDRKFDIVLAIDGTGNEKDFGYLKGALVQLLDRLIMGESKVQVGVVLLGNNDGIQIPISGNRSELEDQIARLGLPDDSNRYDIALKSAGELVAREGRGGVPKVVIMIVNGKSRYEYHTRMEAARLHRSGISVFTVGVGYNTNEEELKTISSSQNEIIRVKNYIHLVYLMTGYVQLFCNVEDNYLTPPTLAPPQQTAKPKARIVAKLTTDVMSEPSPEKAKVLCEGCKMINGAGFNSHLNECDLFVHCYFGELGLRAIIRRCPFGQFWNQTILSCQYSERAYCPMDRCSHMREWEYENPENCRAYWECSNGLSRGKCCRYGYHYVKGDGCIRDIDNTCRKSCPMDSPVDLNSNVNTPTKSCDKIPIANDKKNYQQLSPGTGYVTMPCPEGTQYNERLCTCSVQRPDYPTFTSPYIQEPAVGKGCTPEVKLDFSSGVSDISGKWTYINNQGVEVKNGIAHFNGNSRLLIPRFTNVDFGKTFVIRLRYTELEKLKFNESQALVNNGDCGDFGSVQIFTKRNSIGYAVKTTEESNPVSLQLHKPQSTWKDIEYIVSDQKFEGILNGAHATKWSKGSIESRQCALQIGFGHGYNNFRGSLSMLEIYLCKPEKPMKYS